MTPRRKRMLFIGAVLAGVGLSVALALTAFQQNMMAFFNPTEVLAGEAPSERGFRLGGMVREGSVERAEGSLTVAFKVTDFNQDVPVQYTGVLPDLFREGQGVVAMGRLNADGVFVADKVLAKHDENYMPPEVAEAIEAGKQRAKDGYP